MPDGELYVRMSVCTLTSEPFIAELPMHDQWEPTDRPFFLLAKRLKPIERQAGS